jgi:hypothetical protein
MTVIKETEDDALSVCIAQCYFIQFFTFAGRLINIFKSKDSFQCYFLFIPLNFI